MHGRGRSPWTEEDLDGLMELRQADTPLLEMVAALSRSGEPIDRKLLLLGMQRTN